MTRKAQNLIRELFAVLIDDPKLMPPQMYATALAFEKATGKAGRARAVADYIAGMTDRYAIDEYERLFDPRRLK